MAKEKNDVMAGSGKKVEEKSKDKSEEEPVVEKKDPVLLTLEDIREHCRLLERSVVTKENRFAVRVLRGLPATRKKLSPLVLRKIVAGFYTHSTEAKELLMKYVHKKDDMDIEDGPIGIRLRGQKSAMSPLLAEVDCYLHLLVLLHLLDVEQQDEAVACSEELMIKLSNYNRRSLDHVAARCYYYHTLSHESKGQMSKIRGFLHGKLRTATLNKDFEGQAVLINCLLRNYLQNNLYDQAQKLVEKATFPESASNSEQARYLYYYGRIKAIQLEYTEALDYLVKSLRKAPSSAIGFRQTVEKLRVTVELLLGNIPERQLFLQQANKEALAPYFELTKAVRSGELDKFQHIKNKYISQFKEDRTFTLILRLHHNVIKTAIRRISLAYSRISLKDVAKKLSLGANDNPDHIAAEYIIAKAIKDGVIEATLDHENGWMQSKENTDIYCTREPQLQFHERIQFCLDMHNQSVKAMRFPPKSYNQDLESAEDRREREAQDLELAKEIAEEDDLI
jgi:26S proteasome regulatory subunit N3